MATPTKPRSTDEIKRYDDPFGLDDPVEPEPTTPKPQALWPTGLDDQDDAHRYMAQRFDKDLLLCPNCELIFRASEVGWEEIEGMTLRHPNGDPFSVARCPKCNSIMGTLAAGYRNKAKSQWFEP
jgi:uncharacterized C2H2 Zn-finger protein